jgi:hypothetical protein
VNYLIRNKFETVFEFQTNVNNGYGFLEIQKTLKTYDNRTLYSHFFIKKYSESLVRRKNSTTRLIKQENILKRISLKMCYFIITYWN